MKEVRKPWGWQPFSSSLVTEGSDGGARKPHCPDTGHNTSAAGGCLSQGNGGDIGEGEKVMKPLCRAEILLLRSTVQEEIWAEAPGYLYLLSESGRFCLRGLN